MVNNAFVNTSLWTHHSWMESIEFLCVCMSSSGRHLAPHNASHRFMKYGTSFHFSFLTITSGVLIGYFAESCAWMKRYKTYGERRYTQAKHPQLQTIEWFIHSKKYRGDNIDQNQYMRCIMHLNAAKFTLADAWTRYTFNVGDVRSNLLTAACCGQWNHFTYSNTKRKKHPF